MQQHKKGAHLLNKFKVTSLVGKIDSVLGRNFIDQVYIKYESIITTSYATTMRNLREAIKEKSSTSTLRFTHRVLLPRLLCATGVSKKLIICSIAQLGLSDFYLNPYLKKDLRGKNDNKELQAEINSHFTEKEENIFRKY